jgi:hypothetical protein
MSNTITNSPINYDLANLLAPTSGVTHALKLTLSLSAGTVSIPMNSLVNATGNTYQPQAMTVDNTQSASTVTVTETTYGWSRQIGAGAWRTFQFPSVPGGVFQFTSAGSAAPTISFYDWPAFPDQDEAPGTSSSVVTIAGQPIAVTISDQPVSTTPALFQITYEPATGPHVITTGGTAVDVFGPGELTTQGVIYNPTTAPGILYVDAINPAQTTSPGSNGTTFEILPGGSFVYQANMNTITANSATSGHAFAAMGD